MMVKDILKGAKKGNRTDHWMDKGSEPEPTPRADPRRLDLFEMDAWQRHTAVEEHRRAQEHMWRRRAIEEQAQRREWQEKMAPPKQSWEDSTWRITNGSTAI